MRRILAGTFFAISFVMFFVSKSNAAIVVDAQNYIDIQVSIPESVTVIPGIVSTVQASLKNIGTVPIEFQQYSLLSGYDFFAPGLAIGTGGIGWTGLSGIAPGIGDPNVPFSSDFTHLNNVTINPGDTLEFALFSLIRNSDPDAFFETFTEFYFGSPYFQGFVTIGGYHVDVFAGQTYSAGPYQNLNLYQSSFGPGGGNGGSAGVAPEPSTLLLLSLGGFLGFFKKKIR